MKRKGFALIELLVVVLIIGILAAVALPQYEKAVEKSRMAEAVTLVRAIANANQLFYLENGRYATPEELDQLDITIPGTPYSGAHERIQTKYFVYAPGAANDHDHAIGAAQRIPFNGAYRLWISSDDAPRLHCLQYPGASAVQKTLCKRIEDSGTF